MGPYKIQISCLDENSWSPINPTTYLGVQQKNNVLQNEVLHIHKSLACEAEILQNHSEWRKIFLSPCIVTKFQDAHTKLNEDISTPWSSLPHLVFLLTTKTTKWIWNDFCTILTMFCGHWGLISSLLQKSENYVSWRLGCSIDNLSSFSNSFLEVDAICKEWYVQKLQSQDKMILTFDQIFRNLLRFRYVGQLSFRSKSQKCVRVTLELGEKCSTHCYRINFIYFSPKISAQEFKNHFQINSGRVFRLLCFSTKNSFCPSV